MRIAARVLLVALCLPVAACIVVILSVIIELGMTLWQKLQCMNLGF